MQAGGGSNSQGSTRTKQTTNANRPPPQPLPSSEKPLGNPASESQKIPFNFACTPSLGSNLFGRHYLSLGLDLTAPFTQNTEHVSGV